MATLGDGMLDLRIDPKLAWALANRDWFPLDINKANREQLLRVPGMGVRSVDRIIATRRHHSLRLDDLVRLHLPLTKLLPFIITPDYRPTQMIDSSALYARLTPPAEQFDLFGGTAHA